MIGEKVIIENILIMSIIKKFVKNSEKKTLQTLFQIC